MLLLVRGARHTAYAIPLPTILERFDYFILIAPCFSMNYRDAFNVFPRLMRVTNSHFDDDDYDEIFSPPSLKLKKQIYATRRHIYGDAACKFHYFKASRQVNSSFYSL